MTHLTLTAMTHHHCTPPPHLKTKVLESSCLTPYPSSPSPVSRLPSPVSHHLPSPISHLPSPISHHLPSPVTAHLQSSAPPTFMAPPPIAKQDRSAWLTSCLKPMTCPHDMSVNPPPPGLPSPTISCLPPHPLISHLPSPISPVSRLPSPVSRLPSPVTAHLQSSALTNLHDTWTTHRQA
jgi:hypothetical protein